MTRTRERELIKLFNFLKAYFPGNKMSKNELFVNVNKKLNISGLE